MKTNKWLSWLLRTSGVPADDIQNHYEIIVFEVWHVCPQDVGLHFQLDILKREVRGTGRFMARTCDWETLELNRRWGGKWKEKLGAEREEETWSDHSKRERVRYFFQPARSVSVRAPASSLHSYGPPPTHQTPLPLYHLGVFKKAQRLIQN